MYDNKIAVVILKTLEDWQKLNVTSFLASSIAIALPETHGAPLVSASGTSYLPFIKHPILVYGADDATQIHRAFSRARERNLRIGIYTQELFATKNEEGNLAEIAKTIDGDLHLVGIVIYGDNKQVDKAVDKLKFHG